MYINCSSSHSFFGKPVSFLSLKPLIPLSFPLKNPSFSLIFYANRSIKLVSHPFLYPKSSFKSFFNLKITISEIKYRVSTKLPLKLSFNPHHLNFHCLISLQINPNHHIKLMADSRKRQRTSSTHQTLTASKGLLQSIFL